MRLVEGYDFHQAREAYVQESIARYGQVAYPVGIQTFSEVRNNYLMYVDKTGYIYDLTHAHLKYVFLSRPRRFGKSLLVSTLKSYFEGEKDLFKDLVIEKLETEWKKYPVIHLDMSNGKGRDEAGLKEFLIGQLEDCEEENDITAYDSAEPADRFSKLIKRLYRKTGSQVVVLIDEYDAPMLEVSHEEENFAKVRNVMKYFYGPLKTCDPYLKFVFMTGITKFSQMSIFSALNNIKSISMLDRFAAICGITEEEMLSQMPEGINKIAVNMHITKEEAFRRIKAMYDGYHFAWPSPDIYNPYSLVNAFTDGELDSYWFGSGTPTYLIEALRKYKVEPDKIGGRLADSSDFDAPTERMNNITPLLYQSGYITITNYDNESGLYTLDIPNKEVRTGLMKNLVQFYVSGRMVEDTNVLIAEFYTAVRKGEIDGAMEMLQAYLKSVPYTDNSDSEGSYQKLLYVIFDMGGKDIEAEVELHTVDGRIDLTVKTKDVIYIMELKMNRSAAEALRQIEAKDYAAKFRDDGRPIVKVGINFSSATHTIDDWKISE